MRASVLFRIGTSEKKGSGAEVKFGISMLDKGAPADNVHKDKTNFTKKDANRGSSRRLMVVWSVHVHRTSFIESSKHPRYPNAWSLRRP